MKYKFEIGAYTPKTIPMGRLASYMSELAKLLGEQEYVHFESLEEGSTIPCAVVDRPARPKVAARLQSVGSKTAPSDVASAFATLDRMLADDNASGRLYVERNAKLKANILQFPGAKLVNKPRVISVKEICSIDGVVVRIGGTDDSAHIKLEDRGTFYTGIVATRERARQIAKHLYGSTLRLHGEAVWSRIDGCWTLDRMRVADFEVLDDSTLSEVVTQLRTVEGSGWKELEDPLYHLQNLREE